MRPEPRGSGSAAQVRGQSSPPTPTLLRKQPGVHKPPSPPETTEPLSGDVRLISSALQHHPCGEEASGEFRTEEPQGTEGEQGWRRAVQLSGGKDNLLGVGAVKSKTGQISEGFLTVLGSLNDTL